MKPYLSDPDLTLYLGDALTVLRELPDQSVHCCATSPPFFGLRDYGTGSWEGGDEACEHIAGEFRRGTGLADSPHSTRGGAQKVLEPQPRYFGAVCERCGATRSDGQIGLEDSPDAWVEALVDVFREVRRVLHDDGTFWVEIGDSYASNGPGGMSGSTLAAGGRQPESSRGVQKNRGEAKVKDLVGQPWLLAFALRADGWYLRRDIIWHKPNCMPESATDRPTTAHSYVFLLTKNKRYFYDAEAIREPAEWARWGDQTAGKYEGEDAKGTMVQSLTKEQIAKRFGGGRQRGHGQGGYKTTGERNERFQGSVEGVFPQDEIDALLAIDDRETVETKRPDGWASHEGGHGTIHRDGRENGARAELELDAVAFRNSRSVWSIATEPNGNAICSVCGTFWPGKSPKMHCDTKVIQHYAAFPSELVRRMIVAGSPPGGTVLDPFAGSGTTLLVAREQGRNSIGIELNPSYAAMIRARSQQQSLLA